MARIAIIGANSAVGRAIARHAASVPPGTVELVACVRSYKAERQLPALPPGSRVLHVSYAKPESVKAALAGCQSVVHLPGVLIERAGSTYEEANVATTRVVVEAARAQQVSKIVLVGAIGADPKSSNRFYRTKGEAEDVVRSAGIEFTILRAPLVLGEGTEGSAAIDRYLTHGTVYLVGGGMQWQQPLDVRDLARAAFTCARPGKLAGRTLDLAGPERLRYRELVDRAARARGGALRIRSLPIPVGLIRQALALRGRVLGPGFSPDALEVILDSNSIDPEAARAALDLQLTKLEDTLRSHFAKDRKTQ
jgi:uncharacterized protein YbjT (DUF2867 family)